MKYHWFLGSLLLTLLCVSPACKGEAEGDCAASCVAYNDNENGHGWVSRFADEAGNREYSRCLDEAVARSTTAAAMNCTSRGNEACADACRGAGAGR
jgi:hypothetical protein